MRNFTALYRMDLPHRAMDDLRKAGLIKTEQRYRENGGNSSLLYVLKLQKTTECLRKGETSRRNKK